MAATKQYVVAPGFFISETGTRSEIVAPGVYVIETTITYAAFCTPQRDGEVYTQMTGY